MAGSIRGSFPFAIHVVQCLRGVGGRYQAPQPLGAHKSLLIGLKIVAICPHRSGISDSSPYVVLPLPKAGDIDGHRLARGGFEACTAVVAISG